jgi:hypothetical protein
VPSTVSVIPPGVPIGKNLWLKPAMTKWVCDEWAPTRAELDAIAKDAGL